MLDALPKAYSDELYEEKCSQIYDHCYESYYGDGEQVPDAGGDRGCLTKRFP